MGSLQRSLLLITAALLAGCEGPAEEAVRAATKDPDATQFKDVEHCQKDGALVTGSFNAKNSYGAYTGFQSFYWSAESGVVLADNPQFSALVDRCYGPLVIDPNDKVAVEAKQALDQLDKANRLLDDARSKAAREVGR